MMNNIFGKSGYLKEVMHSYEFRKEQLFMAEFIHECLCDHNNALIEAGTGIGKTLAYVIPTLLYAIENEKKIIITTETKALQKQLIDKDIPFVYRLLHEFYNTDFTFSLCLGGSNYPCIKRFEIALTKGKFLKSEIESVKTFQILLLKNEVFTVADLNISKRLWDQIKREGDACNTYRCSHASKCVFLKAKKEWNESTLLVMNHYLYFSNIASGINYLPQAQILIFDEAHSIEEIAAMQLGFSLSNEELHEILFLFHLDIKHNLLSQIKNTQIRDKGISLNSEISSAANKYFNTMGSIISNKNTYMRLREPLQNGIELVNKLKEFIVLLSEADQYLYKDETLQIAYDIARSKLFLFTENLNTFVFQQSENHVYWIEKIQETLIEDVILRGQPVDISRIICSDLSQYESTIFLSATLAINNDFSFIAKRIGIENYKSISLGSSFNFKSQVLLFIAKDINAPDTNLFVEHSSRLSAEIINYLQGNCLILFTSYKMLIDVKTKLNEMIKFPIYSQDELSSVKAVSHYINDSNSVLMGAHSFWQGIDLPGDLVRGVIMLRLPFSVPDHPPIEAKIERIKENGENPFITYQIPEAILKFRQGFGRLIRSKTDKGIIAILDSRIINKPYGKRFLQSIPECKVIYTLDDLKVEYEKMMRFG